MREIRLLDCTLRDGGYTNDWEFGHNTIISVYERLIDSGVDIVEIGFIDDRRPFDINRSILPNTASIEKIYGGVRKRPPMIVGMIDYGTCDLANVQSCKESFVDGIRVIFKKHFMHEAMVYCEGLKKKGYFVCSQLVSITDYSDSDLLELIEIANCIHVDTVSIVDTYGIMDPSSVLHYYELLDTNLDKDIIVGFHAHNNLQLAYANTRTFLDRETDRNVIVDATLFGMGKNAGNAPIELVGMYLNQTYRKQYCIDDMLEAIDESIMDCYKKTPWGYKMYYYLSAYNKCHPNYVKQIKGKSNFSISAINNVLADISPREKKLLYDRDVADKICRQYESEKLNDNNAYDDLENELSSRIILVIGPGTNIQLQKEKVDRFISENHPNIISINYIPKEYDVNFVFVTNSGRYKDMAEDLLEDRNRDIKIISTSNVTPRCGIFDYSFCREPLLETDENIVDNSFLMLLKILDKCNVNRIFCAGLDGYSDKEENYFNPKMEYAFVKGEARYLNHHIREVINNTYEHIDIIFITYSHYTDVEDSYDAAF